MNIELTDEQLVLLRGVVEEYTDILYSSVLDYHKSAQAADEDVIKQAYINCAAEEEEKYDEVKTLRDYLAKYAPEGSAE